MNQSDKAKCFAALHARGNPLVLYNAWDAGSAKAILAGGAKAIATSSWAVAEAQGFRDGEDLPFDDALRVAARVVASVDAPVSLDFEGGYSEDDGELASNVARLLETGIVGINFEDRVVRGTGLYDPDRQARRIAAIRQAADAKGIQLFINARTDLFLKHGKDAAGYVEEALARESAYAAAGASGFFIPGLRDAELIGRICEASLLPVNVMVMQDVPNNARLTSLGVARISYGALPYSETVDRLRDAASKLFI